MTAPERLRGTQCSGVDVLAPSLRSQGFQPWRPDQDGLATHIAEIIGLVAVLSVGLGLLSLWAGDYPLGFNSMFGAAGLVGVAISASILALATIRANPDAKTGDSDAIVPETLAPRVIQIHLIRLHQDKNV